MKKVLIGILLLGLLGLLAIGILSTGFGIWILYAGSDSEGMQRLVFGFLYIAVGLVVSIPSAWRLCGVVKEFKAQLGPIFTRHGDDRHSTAGRM